MRRRRDRDSGDSARRRAAAQNRCDPGTRQLARYRGLLDGDVLTLVSGQRQTRLYRIRDQQRRRSETRAGRRDAAAAAGSARASSELDGDGRAGRPASTQPEAPIFSATTADVSGTVDLGAPGERPRRRPEAGARGVARQQQGSKLSGYYDRIVHQVSTDGHAYRCSMALEFPDRDALPVQRRRAAATRCASSRARTRCCRRARATTASAGWTSTRARSSTDEIRLIWGVGGQILRRPRPDVPDAAVLASGRRRRRLVGGPARRARRARRSPRTRGRR